MTARESLAQASTWGRVKANAVAFGLCHRCAAQLAWGHQIGFADVHPPCEVCAPLLVGLPSARLNGWRTVTGQSGAADPRNWPSLNAGVGSGGTGTPGDATPRLDVGFRGGSGHTLPVAGGV